MLNARQSRRPMRTLKRAAYRLVSILSVIVLCIPPGVMAAPAQASGTPTPASPTPVETASLTAGATVTESATASATPEPTLISTLPYMATPDVPAATPTFAPTDTPQPTGEPTSDLPAAAEVSVSGGALESADGEVTITFPANAVTETVSVNYTPLANPPADVNGYKPALFAFEVTAEIASGPRQGQGVHAFVEPLKFTIDLTAFGLRPGMDGRLLWFGYFNEEAQLWERIPFGLDDSGGRLKIKASVDHFSSFAVNAEGNPGWSLLYNEPQVNDFTGAATFSYPIDLPPGANGIQPGLALTYNNQQVSGLHGWYQSDWVGHGWSLNTVEIVRELGNATTNHGAECTSKFTLLFNGTGYTLIAANGDPTSLGRYYTQEESSLYIERVSGGMDQGAGDDAVYWYNNTIREYWIVKDANGTEYRIGYKGLAEQLVRSDNQGTCSSREIKTLRSLNDNGSGDTTRSYFAFRWRLDRITDVYGNAADLNYAESRYRVCTNPNDPNQGIDDYFGDRANYLSSISYNNVTVQFSRSSRDDQPGGDGHGRCGKLFFQSDYLSQISVRVNNTPARSYQFGYTTSFDTERTPGGNLLNMSGMASRRLTSIQETGYDANGQNPAAMPPTTMSYLEFKNFDKRCMAGVNCPPPNNSCGGNPFDCIEYHYWHLWRVHNGYGTTAEFYYESDGRTAFWYYDGGHTYRVTMKTIGYAPNADSVPAGTSFHPLLYWLYSYNRPCYNQTDTSSDALGTGGTICPAPPPANPSGVGRLVGHETVTVRSFANSAEVNRTVYTFEVGSGDPNRYRLGRELSRQVYNPATNALMSETLSTHDTQLLWSGSLARALTTPTQVTETVDSATMTTTYTYDSYGNPLTIYRQGTAAAGDEQYIERAYLNSTASPLTTWLIGKAASEKVSAGPGQPVLADTRYFYDGQTPFAGTCPVDNVGCALTTTPSALGLRGALTAAAKWIGGMPAVWSVSQTEYDSHGNVVRAIDPRLHETTFEYADARFPFLPTSTSNALGHTTSMTYDGRGLISSLTDPNGQTIHYEYDVFGRLIKVYEPNNPATFAALEYQYTDNYSGGGLLGLRVIAKARELSGGSTTLDTYTFYNGMGQVVQSRSPMGSGQQSVANVVYGAGKTVIDGYAPAAESLSADFSRPAGWDARSKTHTEYDALLRPISVTVPGISTPTQTVYGPLNVTLIDANGHKTMRYLDGLGRLTKAEEYEGTSPSFTLYATTTYAYDALGKLLNVQPPAGGATAITYDNLGRKTAMTDPAMGAWTYQYDAGGNLIWQTDARGQAICLAYDALGRLKSKSYSGCNDTPAVQYTYDAFDPANGQFGKGRRTGMTDSTGSTTWRYDYLGRMDKETRAITVSTGVTDNSTIQYSFDLLGRVRTTTYPDGEVVTQTYDTQGLPQTLAGSGNYVSSATYNALSQMTQLSLGNTVNTTYGYDTAFRLNALAHRDPINTLANYAYTFDNVGNIKTVSETLQWPLVPAPDPNCIPVAMDYDGNGKDNFTQLCNGTWYFYHEDGTLNKSIWTGGAAGDKPAPGDFNGDGQDEVVVFSSGAWQFYDFVTGNYLPGSSVWTGTPGTPTPMDYDGDSTDDFAVFENGAWHFYNDAGSYNKGIWTGGAAGDKPAPGDFNGDGQDEVVVFSSGAWQFYDFVTGNYLPGSSVWTGTPGTPTPMDYDGDSTDDFAVFENGAWHFYNDAGSYNKGIWIGGPATDVPAPANYEGSLADEVVIFREGVWRFYDFATGDYLRSSNAYSGTLSYNYDALDRLTRADYPDGSFIDYSYDVMGNLNFTSNIGGVGNSNYGYDTTNNRLTAINGMPQGYDANGNMTSRVINGVTWTQNFDAENRLTSMGNGTQTWQFAYDGDGSRVKQVEPNGDVTVYVGGLYEVTYRNGAVLRTRKYYTFGAQMVAMRDNGTLYYLHGDNLGSASLTTNASGGAVSQNRYYPFGATRFTQGTRPTALDFTGQRLDGTGLHFYNARYYDSLLGRFVSADTIVPEPGNSQAFNRYTYASNNPVKYVDPSGHCWGVASGVRGLPSYGTTCNNLDMASTIIQHPKETLEQEGGALVYALAVGYEIFEWGAHIGLAVGATGLACSAVAPCVKAAEATLGIGTAACADGDCSNEANTAVQVTQQGLNVFAKASEYGIRTYNQLSNQLSGTGLRAHHIIEQRFADILGVKPGQMLSVALTPEEHQLFTNAWRNAIGHSNSNAAITTLNATKEQIWAAAQKIYANYPELLEAARLTIFGK